MKQIKCSEMGGPASCNTILTGSTAQEMIENGWTHIQEAHPEMAADIQKNTKEMNDQWMADFSSKFDSLQDA